MNKKSYNNDYIPSPVNEPTCQGMFDDYIPSYVSINKPIPKYQILYKEKLYDIFIISNIGTSKLYDTRLLQNIPAERYYLRLEGEFNTKFALKTRDGFHTKFAKKTEGRSSEDRHLIVDN